MNWILNSKDGIIINLKIVPNAKHNKIDGILGERLKVRIQAPPADGKANKMLVKFLSGIFDLPRSHVTIVTGESGRLKRIAIRGINKDKATLFL